MTLSLYAGIAVAVCSVLGMLFGYGLGRSDERKAWAGLLIGLYKNCNGADEFKVEVVAKTQAIRKDGWR